MGRADDFLLTPEELRVRKLKRRRLVIIVSLLILGLAAAIYAARPTVRAIKGWQARRHAEKAFVFIEQEKWREAQESAVAAYQLRPVEPQAIRAVARVLSRTGQLQALDFWAQLAERQPLTREDSRDEATVAMMLGESARANGAVERLLAGDQGAQVPADWLLAARAAAAAAEPNRAHEFIDKILADPRASEREQLQAALLRFALPHSNPEATQQAQEEAWSRIIQLARSEKEAGIEALLVLTRQAVARSAARGAAEHNAPNGDAAVPGLPPVSGDDTVIAAAVSEGVARQLPAIDELAAALESHPFAKPPHKFAAIDLRIHIDPSRRDALIEQAITQWKDADDAAVATLGAWLNAKGRHESTLAVLPLDRATRSAETFLQHLDALGGLGRWEAVRQLLESDRFPLDPVLQRMYLARCNAQLGHRAAAENNWQRALEEAGAAPGKLMTVAQYAEQNGSFDTAHAAYTQATSLAPKLRPAWAGRLRAAQAAKHTRQVNEVLSGMLTHWPADPAIQNDEAYTRLLLLPNDPAHPELNEIANVAERLVSANPSSLPHRSLLALARLKQDRPAEALQVYDGIQAAADALTSSALAIHAAVLHANGHSDEARSEIAQVKSEALLPEERALIANLRN